MRIAHVSDCYLPRLGGIERQVHGLASAQHDLGHDVEVITSVAGPPEPAFPVHRPRRRARVQPVRAIGYLGSWHGRDVVLDGGFDLVHVHLSSFSPLAFRTAQACAGRIPTAITVHSRWSYLTPLYSATEAFSGWRHWGAAWSAVSVVAVDELATALHGAAVSLLPNATAADEWSLPTRLSAAPPTIVSTMRLTARKRPLQLLRLLAQLRNLLPPTVELDVKIIGDGPLRDRMQRFLQKHRMTGWVRLLGRLDAPGIRSVYADADIYVSPANLESFGIAALEARCAGLPVVAFRQTGTADFITDRVNGLLADDDDGMMASLAELVTDSSLRMRINHNNRSVVPDQTWAKVTMAADRLYQRAMNLCPVQQTTSAGAK